MQHASLAIHDPGADSASTSAAFLSGTESGLLARGAASVFPKANQFPSTSSVVVFLPFLQQDRSAAARGKPSSGPVSPSAVPPLVLPPRSPLAAEAALKLKEREQSVDPAQLRLQPQAGRETSSKLDNILIFLLETVLVAAFKMPQSRSETHI